MKVPLSPSPGELERKQILVYENKQGALYVQGSELPWLLKYLHQEMQGASVPEPADAEKDEAGWDESRPWVARWCPSGAWTVKVMSGALSGKEWRSRIQDLSEDKWAKGAPLAGVEAPLQGSPRSQQKDVLLAYLESVVSHAILQDAPRSSGALAGH